MTSWLGRKLECRWLGLDDGWSTCIARKAENAYWCKLSIWRKVMIVIMTRDTSQGDTGCPFPLVTWKAILIHTSSHWRLQISRAIWLHWFGITTLCDCCDCTLHSAGNCFASRIDKSLFHRTVFTTLWLVPNKATAIYYDYFVRLTLLKGVWLDEDQLNRV